MKRLFVLAFILFFVVGLFAGTLRIAEATTITVTRTFTSLSYDGYIYTLSDSYANGWGATYGSGTFNTSVNIYLGQQYFGAMYHFRRSFVYFDTSITPDNATILSAKLSLYIHTNSSTTDFNVTVQNGQPTYPHIPLESGDYNKAWYSGNGGSRNTSEISALNYWNITLNADGLNWISKTEITKLCLRSSRDIDGTAPSGDEYVAFYSSEQGEAYAPKLYVTYETEGYRYIIYGPYYENGAVANCVVNVTLQIENMASQNYFLNGTDGVADNQTIDVEQRGVAFTWNITSEAYNQTRTYSLTAESFEEIYVFIPRQDEIFYVYTFTVTDMIGVSNAYLETVINVAGVNRIVERQSLAVVNAVPFWMVWARRYTLRLTCNRGTYTYGDFIALNEQNNNLIITSLMFPTAPSGMNVSCTATRKNDTWIQVNYVDNDYSTTWLYVAIQNKSGYGYVTQYSTNGTGNTQQINWYEAAASSDYRVVATALYKGAETTYSFTLPKLNPTANVWDGIFECLGDWPFPPRNLFGFLIVLFFMGLFTYAYAPAGCVATCITAGILMYIGFLDLAVGIPGLVFAFIVSFLFAVAEAKKDVREG